MKKLTQQKLQKLFAASAVVLAFGSSHVLAAPGDDHDLKPLHGGIVAEANHIEYELVLKDEGTELYARDHGKAIDLSKATGKITVLAKGQKHEHALAGTSKALTGPAIAVDGSAYTAVATLDVKGKKSTVRFQSK